MRCRSPFLFAGLLLVACRVTTVTPVPMAGPVPNAIVVWPRIAGLDAGTTEALLSGLDRAVRRRGYQVPSTLVASEALGEHPAANGPEPAALARLGSTFGVEAVLVVEVRDFTSDGPPLRAAQWDLTWRLLRVADAGESWRHHHRGRWLSRPPEDDGALRQSDDTLQPVLLGGERFPDYHAVPELVADLHRAAMDHLPPNRR